MLVMRHSSGEARGGGVRGGWQQGGVSIGGGEGEQGRAAETFGAPTSNESRGGWCRRLRRGLLRRDDGRRQATRNVRVCWDGEGGGGCGGGLSLGSVGPSVVCEYRGQAGDWPDAARVKGHRPRMHTTHHGATPPN